MQKRKPLTVKVLIACVLLQGISGMFGGVGLIIDPSGRTLNIPLIWIQNSPFSDYLIPGIILFTVLGVFPLIISVGLIRGKLLSWRLTLMLAFALIVWILVEIIIIGYQADPPLQLIYGLLGITILLLTISPSTKKFFAETK